MIDPIIKTKSYRFHAAYIPWIVLFMSVFTLNLKTGMAAISLSAANITRILMVVFAGLLSVFYLLTSKRAFGHVFDIPILCFLMFGIAGIISGAYATEGYYAIWKAIEICVDVIAIVIIFHVSPARNAVLMLFRITVILYALILLSVLVGAVISPSNAFIYMPRAFFKYQLSGVFPIINPNSVGFISAFLSIILLVCFIQTGQRLHKLFYLLLFLVAFISLILAQARTSIVAFIAATSAYLFFDRRIKSLLAFIVALSLLFSLDVSASYLQRGQSKELLNTMSGRTVAWENAWHLFEKSPIIGNGFASASKFDVLKGSSTTTLHGSVLDVLVGVGILGFIPWAVAIVYTGIRLVWPLGGRERSGSSRQMQIIRAVMVSIYVLILVKMITSSLLASHESFFLLFLILTAYSTIPETATEDPFIVRT